VFLTALSENYAQQLAFFDKRVASEVEFYKKLLEKSAGAWRCSTKTRRRSCLSDVKTLPIVATTTVPRKARLPIKRQLSSSTTAKSKRATF
jgi:hypothetical protein